MKTNNSYAVFGLGRYGMAVAKELVESGTDVLSIDHNEELINDVIGELSVCRCADVTDPEVIKQLGISNIDVVIIAISGSLETSVMATALCKEAGVKNVIVKCSNEMHAKILTKVGADRVVLPERESGVRLAKNLLSSGFIDMVELTSDISMVELDIKEEWLDKSLAQLNLRKKYSLNVVAVKSNDRVDTLVDPNMPLKSNMKLIVIADISKLGKLK